MENRFDGNVECQRLFGGEIKTNVPWKVHHHSPTGMNWGYAGSGPADMALNILLAFYIPRKDDPTYEVHSGHQVPNKVGDLYQMFKFEFIVSLPAEGGKIGADDIYMWMVQQGVDPDQIRFPA